jgi:hypothetical protein
MPNDQTPTPGYGDTCAVHGVPWQMPWPREPGERNVEYVGHVLLHQTAEGGLFVYWHPMDPQQWWAEALKP